MENVLVLILLVARMAAGMWKFLWLQYLGMEALEAHLVTVYLSRKLCWCCDTVKVSGMSFSQHKYQFQIQNTLTVSGCFTGWWEPLNLACAYLQDLKITSQIPGGTVINHTDTTELNSSASTGPFLTKSLLPVNYLLSCLCLKKVWHDLRLLLEFPGLFFCVGHRFRASQS